MIEGNNRPPGDDADESLLVKNSFLSFNWQSLIQWSSVVGSLSYFIGWTFAERFYGAFGVAPEDVGVTASTVVVRVVLVVVSMLGILVLSYSLLFPQLYDHLPSVPLMRKLGTDLGATGGVSSMLAGRFLAGALAALVLCNLFFAPYIRADRLSELVKVGRPIVVWFLPGTAAFRVDNVRVSHVGSNEPDECLLRLGSNNGTSVFWDPADSELVRISDQNIQTHTPCLGG